jgi:hypothetical protein
MAFLLKCKVISNLEIIYRFYTIIAYTNEGVAFLLSFSPSEKFPSFSKVRKNAKRQTILVGKGIIKFNEIIILAKQVC